MQIIIINHPDTTVMADWAKKPISFGFKYVLIRQSILVDTSRVVLDASNK